MAEFVDVKTEYTKDKNLKKEDVTTIVSWVKNQPHLPEINELQAIAFLKKNYYHIESTKKTIDTFFTLKKLWPDLFANRTFTVSPLKGIFDVITFIPLPKQTPEGHTLFLMKVLSSDILNYDTSELIKFFDMTFNLYLHQHGTLESYHIVMDSENLPYAYLPKFNFLAFKRYFYFMQEVMPGYPKGFHCITHCSFMDEVLAVLRSAMPKALLPNLHVHNSAEDVEKYIPIELLPMDYGGSLDSVDELKEKWEQELLDNASFFEWEDFQVVDEDKRPSKTKHALEVENGLSSVF